MKRFCAALILIVISLIGCTDKKITVPDNLNQSIMISHFKKPVISFINLDDYKITTTPLNFRISAMEKIHYDTVIMSGEAERFLYTLNLQSGIVTKLQKTRKGINGLLYDKKDNLLYYTNGQENTVSILKMDSQELVGEIPVGKLPIAMALNNDDQLLYVVNSKDSTVSVIDVQSNKEMKSFPIVKRPNGMFFDGEFLWIGGHGEYGTLNEYVYIYDPDTGNEIDRIKVSLMPVVFYSEPSNQHVYVICHGSNTVYSIDIASRSIVNAIEVDANPYAITGDKQNLYVTSIDGNTLSIINKSNFQLLESIPLEDGPYRMILGENNA